jgi:hypothetical protein
MGTSKTNTSPDEMNPNRRYTGRKPQQRDGDIWRQAGIVSGGRLFRTVSTTARLLT